MPTPLSGIDPSNRRQLWPDPPFSSVCMRLPRPFPFLFSLSFAAEAFSAPACRLDAGGSLCDWCSAHNWQCCPSFLHVNCEVGRRPSRLHWLSQPHPPPHIHARQCPMGQLPARRHWLLVCPCQHPRGGLPSHPRPRSQPHSPLPYMSMPEGLASIEVASGAKRAATTKPEAFEPGAKERQGTHAISYRKARPAAKSRCQQGKARANTLRCCHSHRANRKARLAAKSRCRLGKEKVNTLRGWNRASKVCCHKGNA